MRDKIILAIVAIICVSALEAIALFKGLDGALFGAAIAAIAGLGGFVVGSYEVKEKS